MSELSAYLDRRMLSERLARLNELIGRVCNEDVSIDSLLRRAMVAAEADRGYVYKALGEISPQFDLSEALKGGGPVRLIAACRGRDDPDPREEAMDRATAVSALSTGRSMVAGPRGDSSLLTSASILLEASQRRVGVLCLHSDRGLSQDQFRRAEASIGELADALCAEERVADEALESASEMVVLLAGAKLNVRAASAQAGGGLHTIEGKQRLSREINEECRRHGLVIAHPDSGEACSLFAVNDKWGGKFLLEHKRTKKRSHSASDITDLLPFKLIAIPKSE